MLDLLPAELLQEVLAHVHTISHLLCVSRVSKILRFSVFSRLFEVVKINARLEVAPWSVETIPYLTTSRILRVPNVLKSIKELHFCAPFEMTEHEGEETRCKHWLEGDSQAPSIFSSGSENDLLSSDGDMLGLGEDDDAEMQESEPTVVTEEFLHREYGDIGLAMLGVKMLRLLSALPKNQLTVFRWDMGTCFPNSVLGFGGYLATKQKRIRKLSLMSEIDCRARAPSLENFAHLQDLSWRGIVLYDDFCSLERFLRRRHKNVRSLELDFIDWGQVERFNDISSDNFDDGNGDNSTPMVDLIIPKRYHGVTGFLPNLQTLSLSAASFKGSLDQVMNAFNFEVVSELRLLHCKRTVELLHHMAGAGVFLAATKVELTLRQVEDCGIMFDLIDFLAPFMDLEDLFLMFQADYADPYYVSMILRFQDTLRRLVYHRRLHCIIDESPYFEEHCDCNVDRGADGVACFLCDLELESLGICGSPYACKANFESSAPTAYSLNLLHLRFTGKAVRKPKFFDNEGKVLSPLESVDDPDEGRRNAADVPRLSPSSSGTNVRADWESIQGKNWREDEERELEDFADWAFGPSGFPCLLVLASGDFSHGQRFAESHSLWCRNTSAQEGSRAWREVEQSDFAEHQLIDANIDMLSACPVSPLLYNYGQADIFPGLS